MNAKLREQMRLVSIGISPADAILISHGFNPIPKEQRQAVEGESWRPPSDDELSEFFTEERICGRAR